MIDATNKAPSPEQFRSPCFFFANDEDSRITFVSPSVEDVLGYSAMDQIGRSCFDFLVTDHPLNADVEECRFRRFRGDGNQCRLRAVRAANGQLRYLAIQTHGVNDECGRVVRNHGVATDVTHFFGWYEPAFQRLRELQQIEDELTDREHAVLSLIMAGRLNKSIARELDISVRTVENIRARMMRKFGVEHVAQIASLANERKTLAELVNSLARPLDGPETNGHHARHGCAATVPACKSRPLSSQKPLSA